MKIKLIITLIGCICLGAIWGVCGQEESQALDTSSFEKASRPPVWFDHDEHNEKASLDECAICHHVYEDKKLVPDESSEDSSCSDCHLEKKTAENSISLRAAFHAQCRTCHFSSGNGPVLCGECHKRRG